MGKGGGGCAEQFEQKNQKRCVCLEPKEERWDKKEKLSLQSSPASCKEKGLCVKAT